MLERLLHFFERYPLDLISHLSSGFPIIVGLIQFKKLNRSEKLIWFLFVFLFLKDTYALIYMFIIPNNLFVTNIEQTITTLFVGSIYYYSFEKASQRKLIFLLTLVCASITIFTYESLAVSTISSAVFRLFSIILALFYFNKIMTDMQVKIITKYSLFWFTAALLIYTTGTFFIILFSEYWNKDVNEVSPDTHDLYLNRSQMFFIVFCLLSAYSLWVSKYKSENYI